MHAVWNGPRKNQAGGPHNSLLSTLPADLNQDGLDRTIVNGSLQPLDRITRFSSAYDNGNLSLVNSK